MQAIFLSLLLLTIPLSSVSALTAEQTAALKEDAGYQYNLLRRIRGPIDANLIERSNSVLRRLRQLGVANTYVSTYLTLLDKLTFIDRVFTPDAEEIGFKDRLDLIDTRERLLSALRRIVRHGEVKPSYNVESLNTAEIESVKKLFRTYISGRSPRSPEAIAYAIAALVFVESIDDATVNKLKELENRYTEPEKDDLIQRAILVVLRRHNKLTRPPTETAVVSLTKAQLNAFKDAFVANQGTAEEFLNAAHLVTTAVTLKVLMPTGDDLEKITNHLSAYSEQNTLSKNDQARVILFLDFISHVVIKHREKVRDFDRLRILTAVKNFVKNPKTSSFSKKQHSVLGLILMQLFDDREHVDALLCELNLNH